MSEIGNEIERRQSFDFAVLKSTFYAWHAASNLPGLAETIIQDTTPLPDADVNYYERTENGKRKVLFNLLTREEYLPESIEQEMGDEVIYGLSEAVAITEPGTIEQEALVTLLQAYRVHKKIAPQWLTPYDPRRIAFRVLNPVKPKRQ